MDTVWDLEETQGEWCVMGSRVKWYKHGGSQCEDDSAAAVWGSSGRCTLAPVLWRGSSAIPWVEPQPTHLPCAVCQVVRLSQGWLKSSVLPDPVSGASLIALFQKETAISLPLPLPSSV